MPPVSSPEPGTFVCQGVHDPFLFKKKKKKKKRCQVPNQKLF